MTQPTDLGIQFININIMARDYPEDFDFEEGSECEFCGAETEDGKRYCSRQCYLDDNKEGI